MALICHRSWACVYSLPLNVRSNVEEHDSESKCRARQASKTRDSHWPSETLKPPSGRCGVEGRLPRVSRSPAVFNVARQPQTVKNAEFAFSARTAHRCSTEKAAPPPFWCLRCEKSNTPPGFAGFPKDKNPNLQTQTRSFYSPKPQKLVTPMPRSLNSSSCSIVTYVMADCFSKQIWFKLPIIPSFVVVIWALRVIDGQHLRAERSFVSWKFRNCHVNVDSYYVLNQPLRQMALLRGSLLSNPYRRVVY